MILREITCFLLTACFHARNSFRQLTEIVNLGTIFSQPETVNANGHYATLCRFQAGVFAINLLWIAVGKPRHNCFTVD